MTPVDVKKYYGNQYKFNKITGMSSSTLGNWIKWGFVPEDAQYKLERLTKGELKMEPSEQKIKKNEIKIKKFCLYICILCLQRTGLTCNTPGCSLIRLPMELIKAILNTLDIR